MPENDSRLFRWLAPLALLTDNAISLTGVVLVTTGGISWFFLLPFLWESQRDNPYFGILWVLDLIVFLVGLALIPIGAYLRRAKLRREGLTVTPALESSGLRHLLTFVGVTTMANIVIAGSLTTAAVNYMETKSFCGAACHVMTPEFNAFQNSPHAEVDCVHCHAGPGAAGFIKSKIAGTRQLVLLLTSTYDRPIPVPARGLPPATETCRGCHSLNGHPEDLVRVITKFGDDEKNTPNYTVLLMHLNKIHRAHMGDRTIRYAADAKLEMISRVDLIADGKTTVFSAEGAKGDSPAEMRTMDCLDCHNRPAHTFQQPERAVDRALNGGTIPSLPFVKKHAIEVLKKGYASQDEAAMQITSALTSFYPDQPRGEVDKAAAVIVDIYKANVFPQMKVDWGTYPTYLGHIDSPGCFRCHDEAHTSPAGAKLSQDCSLCHNLAAMEEPSPQIVTDLGLGK